MGFKVVEVQATPNPDAMKFVLDRPVADSPRSYFSPAAASSDPLAVRLFAIEGVASLLFLSDFVTVNKTPNARWPAMTPRIRQALAEA